MKKNNRKFIVSMVLVLLLLQGCFKGCFRLADYIEGAKSPDEVYEKDGMIYSKEDSSLFTGRVKKYNYTGLEGKYYINIYNFCNGLQCDYYALIDNYRDTLYKFNILSNINYSDLKKVSHAQSLTVAKYARLSPYDIQKPLFTIKLYYEDKFENYKNNFRDIADSIVSRLSLNKSYYFNEVDLYFYDSIFSDKRYLRLTYKDYNFSDTT